MAEKRGLGHDFDIHEIRPRLKGQGREPVAPVDPARGMRVDPGRGEDPPPDHPGQKVTESPPFPRFPTTKDVVTGVDRLEHRLDVRGGPGLLGRRHEDQRAGGRGEPLSNGLGGAQVRGNLGEFEPASAASDQTFQGKGDLLRQGRIVPFPKDHRDRGSGQRLAPEVGFPRIDRFLGVGRGHPASAGRDSAR